ncbi:MAG TPA: T9SS type A sorting domain-containing protein, partial [Bacteroidales bacterium]|nr:T9SS type A sorting domain-containing protein [Bacteroidales bacterium]
LSWDAVSDDDFQYYVIDKSADSLFMTDQYGSFTTTDTFFNDTSYEYGTVYYRVSAIDYAGNRGDYSNTVSTSILSLDSDVIPKVFALHQNYPNPFNPVTQIRYDLPEDATVNITIYDMVGRVVKTMVNSQQNAGFKSVLWNTTNDFGKPVSAGVYLYRIQASEFVQASKMVLIK